MKKISLVLHSISLLIGQGKYQEALEQIKDYEKTSPSDLTLGLNKPGFLIDIGYGLKDHEIVKEGLLLGENNLADKRFDGQRTNTRYNLGNGYLSLYGLTEKGVEAIPQSQNLQKAKEHFRQATLSISDPHLKKQLLVNYGNCLDTLGRGVESLYIYDEALQIDKDFAMAIGNRAKALRFFADISGEYRGVTYGVAYQAIKSIIDNQDLLDIGGLGAKQSFEHELRYIESRFKIKSDLEKELKHSNHPTENLSDFEKFYIDYCSKEKLFLNFHVHLNLGEASITDPVFISMVTKIEDNDSYYHFAKYINQIKEDYAVARLALVQSQYKNNDFDSISNRTTFMYSLDYSQFNLYVGLLKSAFKEAYNVLDKIAVFINDYYKLGLPEDKIYFTTIWQKNGVMRQELLDSKNISLYALYDIYQDFKSNEYVKIQNIRNAAMHRRLVVFDSVLTDWDKKDDKHNIGYETMLSETIKLFRLTKSAIIYLINFVNLEEGRKKPGEGKFIPEVPVDITQFLKTNRVSY
jgi:hypothetical protein